MFGYSRLSSLIKPTSLGFACLAVATMFTARSAVAQDEATAEDEVVDEIVVRGQYSATRKSLNVERASDAFVSVVSSDDLGEFPDRNLAEVLQRAPAVTLRTQSGEGSFAIVRGIPPFLSTTSINGERLQSAQVEGRENRLGYFGAAAVERVEVRKVFTPEMQGDFIGGNVNVETRRPLGGRDFADLSIEYGDTELRKQNYSEVELTAAKALIDDKLSVLVSLNAADRPQRTEAVGTSLAARYFDSSLVGGTGDLLPLDLYTEVAEIDSERKAAAIDVDYRHNDRFGLRLTTSFTQLDERRTLDDAIVIFNPLAADPDSTSQAGTYITGSSAHRFSNYEIRDVENISSLLKANWDTSALSTEVRLGYGRADIDASSFEIALGQALPNPISYSLADRDFPIWTLSNADVANERTGANYVDSMLRNNGRVQNGVEEEYSIAANFEIPQGRLRDNVSLDFGLRFSDKDKLTDVDQRDFPNDEVGSLLFGANYPTIIALTNQAAMAGNDSLPRGRILDGRYSFGPFISLADGQPFVESSLPEVVPLSDFNSALRDFEAKESVLAGYVGATIDFGRASLIAGVRVERTERDFSTVDALLSLPDTVILPVSTSDSYTKVLPALVLRVDASENLVWRFGATQTYAHPNFEQLVPRALLNPFSGSVQIGNPSLDPTSSLNLDASVDYFLEPLGVVGAAVFYKELSDYIFRTSRIEDSVSGVPGPWAVSTFENAQDASMLGAELRAFKRFDELPAPFDGLGFELSYVYLDSELTTNAGRKAEIPFASPSSANASLLFDTERLGVRISYSYQDKFLRDSISDSEPFNEQFIDERGQVDITFRFHVTEQFSVYGEAFNVTDEPFRRTSRASLPLKYELQGRQYGIGVRVRL